jgi:2,4-dienoyl-CoA reductase-like NADH-dependent reductase (Old Yellow Enzyme family)
VFTDKQVASWKKVTDAVHAKGGLILCQIWHNGRATVPDFIEGHTTLSSSDIPIKGNALNGKPYSDNPPKPMTVEDIKSVTNDFVVGAKRAIKAGFDGVEIHG